MSSGSWIWGGLSWPDQFEFDLPAGTYRFRYEDSSVTWQALQPEAFYGTSVFHFEDPAPSCISQVALAGVIGTRRCR